MRSSIENIHELSFSSSSPPETLLNYFEVVHRPPSQKSIRLPRQNTDLTSQFRSDSIQLTKTPSSTEPIIHPARRQTVSNVPTIYEVKRGSKIYKVVVGYVSPYTSPLQRKELHLKTDHENDLMKKQLIEQQDKQRASKPHLWTGLSDQSASK